MRKWRWCQANYTIVFTFTLARFTEFSNLHLSVYTQYAHEKYEKILKNPVFIKHFYNMFYSCSTSWSPWETTSTAAPTNTERHTAERESKLVRDRSVTSRRRRFYRVVVMWTYATKISKTTRKMLSFYFSLFLNLCYNRNVTKLK